MTKFREWLKGKKSYLLGLAGVLTVAAAWASGELNLTEALAGLWAALQTIFLRAGIAKAGN